MSSHVRSCLSVPTTCDYIMQKQDYCIWFSVPTTSKELVLALEVELGLGLEIELRLVLWLWLVLATSTRERASASANFQELGKITKFLYFHCLSVHKV